MKPTQPEILAYVLQTVQGLCQDWDYADPVGPESLLFTGLGMESLDAVVLCTAIQEHYQTTMPFAELLADIGQKQRDLSIAELAEFVAQHVGATQEPKPEHQAVETGSPRRTR
jgi:acyl carrier protein